MNRFIDPQKIHYFKLANGEKVATKESIDKIPAADVQEVKHGHWFKPSEMSENICSNCIKSTKTLFGVLSDYCPYCGAKMDEGGSEF